MQRLLTVLAYARKWLHCQMMAGTCEFCREWKRTTAMSEYHPLD